MADEDQVKKLMDKSTRLEEQLKKSEKLMSEFKQKLKASTQKVKSVPAGKPEPNAEELAETNRELEKQLETQRKEFEALVGKLNQEIQAAQLEREGLTKLLRLTLQALSNQGEGFEDEPTAAYTKKMHDVIAAEAAQFAEEESTESYTAEKVLAEKAEDDEEES